MLTLCLISAIIKKLKNASIPFLNLKKRNYTALDLIENERAFQ